MNVRPMANEIVRIRRSLRHNGLLSIRFTMKPASRATVKDSCHDPVVIPSNMTCHGFIGRLLKNAFMLASIRKVAQV